MYNQPRAATVRVESGTKTVSCSLLMLSLLRPRSATVRVESGTQFACFTGTKVQILTIKAHAATCRLWAVRRTEAQHIVSQSHLPKPSV